MTTLMPLVSVTGLVLLLLTAAPTSCNSLTPGSHLPSFSRGDVKDEDTSAPGVVIDNVVDVKDEDFFEKDTIVDEFTESALNDDVLQTLKTTGLNADSHDGLPPLQSVERGSKVTSSRAARRRRDTRESSSFHWPFRLNYWVSSNYPITIHHYCKRGGSEEASRDYSCLSQPPYCHRESWVQQYFRSLRSGPSVRPLIRMYRSGNSLVQYHYHYCSQDNCNEHNC